MLWEISVLNKIYKTNLFSTIRARALIGKTLYIISGNKNFSSVLERLDKRNLNEESDIDILRKYNLLHLEQIAIQNPDYCENLYLYECITKLIELNGSLVIVL